MTNDELIEKIARMIAKEYRDEKFWGLYLKLAAQILSLVETRDE